jgi:hypothetical protein
MKNYIEVGLVALKGFYEVVNTRDRVALLLLVWFMAGVTGLGHRFLNPETIERLIEASRNNNSQPKIEATAQATSVAKKTQS